MCHLSLSAEQVAGAGAETGVPAGRSLAILATRCTPEDRDGAPARLSLRSRESPRPTPNSTNGAGHGRPPQWTLKSLRSNSPLAGGILAG